MKKIKTIICSSAVVAGVVLFPHVVVMADDASAWECMPSKDFRSWVCLKDGQAPEEPIPAPVAEVPDQKPDIKGQPESVTVTPLQEPVKIEPVTITPAVVDEASAQEVTREVVPEKEPEPVASKPIEVEPQVLDEPLPPPASEPEPKDEVVVEEPVPAPQPVEAAPAVEPAPEVEEVVSGKTAPIKEKSAPVKQETATLGPEPQVQAEVEPPVETIAEEQRSEKPEMVEPAATTPPEPLPSAEPSAAESVPVKQETVEQETATLGPEPQVQAEVEPPVETIAEEQRPEKPEMVEPAATMPEPLPSAESLAEVAVEEQAVINQEVVEQKEPVKDSVVRAEAADKPVRKTVMSELIRIDNSLPSCVAISRPTSLTGEELRKYRESSAAEIEADEATLQKDKLTTLSGNVRIRRADQLLRADEVRLNKETNQADATGTVIYSDRDVELQASKAHLDMDKDENIFDDVSFTTLDRYARGSANQLRSEKGTLISLDKVQYTSCPPGVNSWMLSADEIVLDDETGRGMAKNAKLEFFDIPVFYAPRLTFPIDDRRVSGLLTPRIANSDDRGFEVTAPIYWNIAPDRDATFYPRHMSKRGLQLGGEFRYLNKTNRGQVNLEYLDSDNKYNDKDRWAFNFAHDAKYFSDWDFETKIRRVSDEQYFEDLSSSLALSSQRHLESRLRLSKSSSNWSFYGLLQDYQTVDRTIASIDRPYERMPHLRFDAWTDTFGNGFQARIDTEYTDFDRKDSITGKRTVLYPSITYNHETAGYYVRPKFGIHYSKYSLGNEGTLPSSPNRSVPIFSVDSGLFYERNTELFGKSMLQTLEPRIYYLKVAEKNQTNIPIFDTGIYDYNSSSLFRENRFSGLDRIGDTDQVSVGITSRFLDPDTGAEQLSLTFGQIYYFSARDVTLPGGTRDDDNSSPIIAEINYRPYDSLVASALVHWDPETSKTERMIYRLKYQPDDHRILNLAYRFRENSLKQTDVSFLWPISNNNRWHAVGRWNHSLRHSRTLDVLGGIEYESCCWKTRFVARRWVNDIDEDYDTGIFFEIELKGLGSIGNDVSRFLGKGILGYDRHIKDEDDDSYYY